MEDTIEMCVTEVGNKGWNGFICLMIRGRWSCGLFYTW